MSIIFTRSFRIITFVPPEYVENVLEAVNHVDHLAYGDYTRVSWRSTPGIERFKSQSNSHPTVGAVGKLSDVPSIRIEFSVPHSKKLLNDVITALLLAHPWEEPVVLVHDTYEPRGMKKALSNT